MTVPKTLDGPRPLAKVVVAVPGCRGRGRLRSRLGAVVTTITLSCIFWPRRRGSNIHPAPPRSPTPNVLGEPVLVNPPADRSSPGRPPQPDAQGQGASNPDFERAVDGGRDPRPLYEARAREFDQEAEEKRRTSQRIGYGRLLLFLIMLATAWGAWQGSLGTAGWWVVIVMTVAFAWLVRLHRRARLRQRRVEIMADVNREAIARVERDWERIPPPPEVDVPLGHDYAKDLDLAGPASLLHLIGTCGTAPGLATLWAWLQRPATEPELATRQEAVADLSARIDLRDALAAEARLLDQDRSRKFEGFLAWSEGSAPEPARPGWLIAASWVLPAANLVLLVLWGMDRIPTPPLTWSLVISTVVMGSRVRRIHGQFAQAEAEESGVREYGPILELLSTASFDSPWGHGARARLDSGERAAHEEIRTLRRLLDLAEMRRSPLFHLPLLILLFWDVHVLRHLEAWRGRAGPHVRDWLAVVGEAEALAALAGLSHQNPDWVDPRVDSSQDRIDAADLAHPLIPPSVRVANDVEVGPAGSFLLVTGSNMSGKSTLLRAVGLNVVLGLAGGRVCASRLAMPPSRVVTSMRVDDSLAGGVSFFMAELQRLKHVVDVAESGEPGVCVYLLDEMLQGTNSAERRVAARSVVRRLVASGSLGAVTTHDLTLAETPDLERIAVPVHFTETVGGSEEGLTFDYRLRPGVAQSTNALKLLRLVGLGDGE